LATEFDPAYFPDLPQSERLFLKPLIILASPRGFEPLLPP
jgi:hypothetical protein